MMEGWRDEGREGGIGGGGGWWWWCLAIEGGNWVDWIRLERLDREAVA